MFKNCSKLKSIGDISDWNMSSVENIGYMFHGCKNLKNVGDLDKWNIIKNLGFGYKRYIAKMFDDSGITNTPTWYPKD